MPLSGSTTEASAITRGITALSVTVAIILICAKAAAWLATGSVALLASLADSGLDLVASLFTFFAVRYAAQPADADHRFGHGKAEAFASLVQASLVFASAAVVSREAIARLLDPQPIRAETIAVGVMVVSIVLTALLVAAQTRALRKVSSVAVSGDRAHYIADIASNALAILGLLGTWLLNLPLLDAVAGLSVAAWLVWGAVRILRDSADQLMDRELPAAERAELARLVLSDPDVRGVHELRTRAAGPTLHIQLHMDLDPTLSLSAAHAIVEAAEQRLYAAYPNADVIIHPDPEGQAEAHRSIPEPTR